jgi:hypothetical protein
MGIGYLQGPDRKVAELHTVDAQETFGANGLPIGMTLDIKPGELTANVDVRGHAPLRLTAADGRVSQFPRAWASVSTADGRNGVGWFEWNRNS